MPLFPNINPRNPSPAHVAAVCDRRTVAAVYDRRTSPGGSTSVSTQASGATRRHPPALTERRYKTTKPSRLRAFAGISLLFLFAIPLQANSDLVGIADREISRRQQNTALAQELADKAQRALADKNLEAAYTDYLAAVQLLPAGEAAKSKRASLLAAFSSTAVDYATSLIGRGEYAQAEQVAKTVLRPEFNPDYKPAVQLLARLEQPGYYNRTITPAFAEKQDEVSKLLNDAQGYFATGRFDLAMKRYEQVLNLDPYNIAARNGMEEVAKQRTNYYDEAYNETRSRMLWLVDREWERPVRKIRGTSRGTDAAALGQEANASKERIVKKLNDIVIKNVDLSGVTIREAVDELKRKSREFDTSETDPRLRGVNLVLKLPATSVATEPLPGEESELSAPTVTESTEVTMNLRNVPLIEAVRYLTEISGLKYKVEPFAVSIVPVTENTDELLTKEYRVSPSFIPAADTAKTEGPVAGTKSQSDSNVRIKGGRDATAFLKEQGIPFPEGAFAQYIPSGSKLIVRNTQANIDTIDVLVEGDMGVPPTQVEIESKFVEISQNNLNELGFDWLLGPFSIGGGVYGDGGTRAGGQELGTGFYQNFPFGNIGSNPVTAGNRNGVGTSAASAITANSVDALLAGVPQGANVASPAIFGLAGIFTNPQFQVVIRALSQQKGVDLMSAPKVTTKSGNKATIKIIREFPYPDSFSPPQLPQQATNNNVSGPTAFPTGALISGGIVTPSSPESFAQRDVGVILEVEPQIGADNYTIDLSISPEVVEFDGFVNYGSPILNAEFVPTLYIPGVSTGIRETVSTPNVINQPIFSIRKVSTSVTIWDGQTVAMGGLIREDVQKVNDKVPILGDIPLAGRLFRSNVDQKIKKNLIVFVTARLMDAEGKPLIQTDEQEDPVEPLGLPEDLPKPTISTRSLGK
jgi:general secretion pathway protein D